MTEVQRNTLEIREISHEGKIFKIQLHGEANSYTVIATHNGQQVSPDYTVSLNTHIDYFFQHKESLIEKLFEIAIDDIKRGVYFRA